MLEDLPWKAILSVSGAVLALAIVAILSPWGQAFISGHLPG
jgi:hypothetical protein